MQTPGSLLFTAALLLLCGVSQAEYGFKPRQEYSFALEGRAVAGFPTLGDKQHAGVHYRGTVKVQRDTSSSLLLKFQNMTYVSLHESMQRGWWAESKSSRDAPKELPITSSAVAIKLGRFDVESVTVKKGLSKWEINFIQGVVKQLHIVVPIGTKPKSSLPSTSFKVKENSLFGRCEVLNEIAKVPRSIALARPELYPNSEICGTKRFYEIYKTLNFSNCDNSSEYHFGLPKSKNCPPGGNECEDFWSRASVTRLSGCGDHNDFEILQTETNTRIIANLHLHNDSQASVSSYIALNLKSVKPISRHLTAPAEAEVIPSLRFQYLSFKFSGSTEDELFSSTEDTDDEAQNYVHGTRKSKSKSKKSITTTPVPTTTHQKTRTHKTSLYEQMRMESPPSLPLTPLAQAFHTQEENFNKIQKLRELIIDASNELEVPKSIPEGMTMEKVLYSVRLCRTMSYIDLSKTAAMVSLQARSSGMLLTERKLLRDILVMCGTTPSFRILKRWLENGQITGEEASETVSSIPSHLLAPDSETLSQFYDLTRALSSRGDFQLKVSAILALSNLLRVACVETNTREAYYYTRNFHGSCRQEDLVNYMSWFISGVRNDGSLRRVFLTALGNTGNVSALPYLKAVAQDPSASAYIRTSAVYSMKYQVINSPEETAAVLMSLYRDAGLPVPVRIAAVSLFFYAKPSLVAVQRLAVSTWYESSTAVAAFVRSSFLSLTKLTDPMYKTLSRYAGMALPLSRPVPLGLHIPYNVMWTRVSSELQEIAFTQMSHDSSVEATNYYWRYAQRHGGLSRVVMTGEIVASNLDFLLNNLGSLIRPTEDISLNRPPIKDLNISTRWIRENLNISERTLPKFEGDIHFVWDKMQERMFLMNKDLLANIGKGARSLIDEMKNGKNFNYQKVNQKSITLQVITELGFPVVFELSVPWAMRMTSSSKINLEKKWLDIDLSLLYTSQMVSELSFFSGWDQTVHMAGSHGVTLIHLPPFKTTASLDTHDRAMNISFKALLPQVESVVIHHSSKPFTSQDDVFSLSPNTLKSSTSVAHVVNTPPKTKSILQAVNVNYRMESPNDSPLMWLKNAVSVQGFCMLHSSLESTFVEVQVHNFQSINLELSQDQAIASKDNINFSTRNVTRIYEKPIEMKTTARAVTQPTEKETTTDAVATASATADEDTTTASTTESLYNVNYFDRLMPRFVGAVTPNVTATTMPATTTPSTTTTTAATITTETYSPSTQTTVTEASLAPVSQYPSGSHRVIASGNYNASNIDPFIVAGRVKQAEYLLTEMLSGIDNGRSYVVKLKAEAQGSYNSTYNVFFAQASGKSGKEQRFGVFAQKTAANTQPTQLKVTSSLQTDAKPILKLEDALRSNIAATLISDLVFGSNDADNRFSVKTIMDRSPALLEKYRQSDCIGEGKKDDKDTTPQCLQEASDAMFLNRYNVTLKYNEEGKQYLTYGKSYFNYFRHWFLPYITTDNQSVQYPLAPSNTIRSVFNLYPQQDSMDFRLWSQSLETEFQNVPVNSLFANALRFHPRTGHESQYLGEKFCTHRGSKWTSFDGMPFDYNLNPSWHVLSKDCSGRTRVVVLARRINNHLEVQINLDNYKIILLQPELNISVNNSPVEFSDDLAEFSDNADTVLVQIERTSNPENIVSVNLPAHAFQVLYTDQVVVVKADARTRNRLCGLCGDNNGEISNDFTNPRGNQEANARDFGSSYNLMDANVSGKP